MRTSLSIKYYKVSWTTNLPSVRTRYCKQQGMPTTTTTPEITAALRPAQRLCPNRGCMATLSVTGRTSTPPTSRPKALRSVSEYIYIYIYYKLIHTLMVNAWDWTLVVFKLSGLGFSHPLGQSDKIMSTNSQNIVSASQRFRSVQTCHVGKQHRCAWCVVGCGMPRKHLHSQLAKKMLTTIAPSRPRTELIGQTPCPS